MLAVLPFIPAKQRPTHPNDWMTSDCLIASTRSGMRRAIQDHPTREAPLHHGDFSVVPLGETNG